MSVALVMRTHNDMPLVATTLRRLHEYRARFPFDFLVMDNASADGTVDEIRKYTQNIITVPEGTYIPGRVLNEAMKATKGELVVFLNSDCIPQHPEWIEKLLEGFTHPTVAAVFGRQIPQTNCQPIFAKDTEDTFGDGARQKYWRHCFSMASSAIRRSVWEKMGFSEILRYSEDIDWTWRVRQAGYEIRYVPDSVIMHSHNYTLKQWHKRQFGEGKADALIFDWDSWQASFLRYSLLPYGQQVLSDWKYSLRTGRLVDVLYAPVLRMAQLLGRRKGLLEGLKDKKTK